MHVVLIPLIDVVSIAIRLYIWVLIVSAVLSWLVAFNILNTRSRAIYTIMDALHRITDPALRPIRRILPNMGGVDISPVILILILYFIQNVLRELIFSPPRDALANAPGGARLAVRLVPRARRDRIEGAVREADGQTSLKVAVSAPPVDGKANTALIALVAATLGVTKNAVSVAAGAGGRRKLLFVAGDAAALRQRLVIAMEDS